MVEIKINRARPQKKSFYLKKLKKKSESRDDSYIESISVIFLLQSRKKIAQSLSAAKAGDYDIVINLLHSLKGSAGMLGLIGFSRFCGKLENETIRKAEITNHLLRTKWKAKLNRDMARLSQDFLKLRTQLILEILDLETEDQIKSDEMEMKSPQIAEFLRKSEIKLNPLCA